MPPDQIIGAVFGVPPASMTLACASALMSTFTPICDRSCWIACAMRGFGSVFIT